MHGQQLLNEATEKRFEAFESSKALRIRGALLLLPCQSSKFDFSFRMWGFPIALL